MYDYTVGSGTGAATLVTGLGRKRTTVGQEAESDSAARAVLVDGQWQIVSGIGAQTIHPADTVNLAGLLLVAGLGALVWLLFQH